MQFHLIKQPIYSDKKQQTPCLYVLSWPTSSTFSSFYQQFLLRLARTSRSTAWTTSRRTSCFWVSQVRNRTLLGRSPAAPCSDHANCNMPEILYTMTRIFQYLCKKHLSPPCLYDHTDLLSKNFRVAQKYPLNQNRCHMSVKNCLGLMEAAWRNWGCCQRSGVRHLASRYSLTLWKVPS